MKTIEDIVALIDQTVREGEGVKQSMGSAIRNQQYIAEANLKKVFNRVTKRLVYYRMVKSYIETKPTREFIQNEYDRVTNRMSMIGLNFSHDALSAHKNTDVVKKRRIVYEKEQGVPKLKEQQKCLKFILGK